MNYKYESTYNKIASLLKVPREENNFSITNLTWKADDTCQDGCYIAIKGNRFNGNDFIGEAINRGAALIITDENIKCDVPTIRVKNARESLCVLAGENIKNTRIIGVTGSVGKTTVKEMIRSVLSQRYTVSATIDNENNEIGVAKTLLSIKNEEFCVVEMGMRGRGELRFLSNVCYPETSVITNSGSAHIERLGSHEEIFKAKCEILEKTKKYCVLPNDNRFINVEKFGLLPFFVGESADYSALNIDTNENSSFFVCENGKNIGRIDLPTISKHNITNSLFAYAVGRIYSLEHNEIKKGLECFKNINLREQIVKVNGITIILDCYNASYEGLKSSIESFHSYCRSKGLISVIVLGCMREAGDFKAEYQYRIGEYIKDLGIKNLIGYNDDSKEFLDGFMGGKLIRDKKLIAKYILSKYGDNYAVLFKGSRSEKLEEIIIEMKEQLK